MNKKGQVEGIILIAFILFIVLFIGLLLVIGSVVIDWTADEVVPELTSLGSIGDANLTEYSGYTITPVNSFIQTFNWLAGFIYILCLVALVGLSFAFRFTGNKWLLGLFIMIMIMLVIASIFVSNIYEEFYNDSGDLGTRLQEHTLLSWLLLYSPLVVTVLGFICGIIMFTGEGGKNQYGI